MLPAGKRMLASAVSVMRRSFHGVPDIPAAAATLCVVAFFLLSGCASSRTGLEKWATQNTSTAPKPGESAALDTDRDSLSDARERDLGSDPFNPDSDKDGFDDGFEDTLSQFGFDLLRTSRDGDKDGLEDGFERKVATKVENPDSDGDGWSDLDEVLNRFYGYDPVVPTADADFDGLADDLERLIGSSAGVVDTNGDGIDDFQSYSAGLNPAGPKLETSPGELIGTTYSPAMAEALEAIRKGGRFPGTIASELPYPRVTQPLVDAGRARPSAALMQRSAFNPHNSPGLYLSYNEIVAELFATAAFFDGSPGPAIVRLFVWSQPTVDCCTPDGSRPKRGRSIYAMKISDNVQQNENEPEVLFMGMHHAREMITTTFTVQLIKELTKGYAANDPAIRKLVDNAEIWVLPVVNPNGYDREVAVQMSWRKNTRKVTPTQTKEGVDINRNYDFEHATSLTIAQRAALSPNAQFSNGISASGAFDLNLDQYPGTAPFTEVESQAVRGLAHNQFLTRTRDEVDGLICSLSWHTYTGVVLHPMLHNPSPPNTGLTGSDPARLGTLGDALASGSGYTNIRDTFKDTFYPVYGDSDSWLYKDGATLALSIEGYSMAEGRIGGQYYPTTATARDAVTSHNIKGAFELIRKCPP